MEKEFKHYSVMLKETIDALEPKDGLVYIDATLGKGGHTKEIAQRAQKAAIISFDVDDEAIKASNKTLKDYKNVTIVKSSYSKIEEVLKDFGIEKITGGIVFDLGASYHQLTSDERGFSFKNDAPLDMRFGDFAKKSAYDVINQYPESELVRIFSEYGEERFSKRIAKAIVEKRASKRLETTKELADLIVKSTPKIKSKIHPATRVFQAVRIEVNQELENIEKTLKKVITLLAKDAKIAVISFHSLEDRIVKNVFKSYSKNCRCPVSQVICTCEGKSLIELINKKPIVASEKEIKQNPPSRSAKLRIAKKL